MHRLCRRHGLKVPRRRRRRRALGEAKNAVHVKRATHRNDVWTWDFVSDQTMNDGRPFRILTVVDEYTREPLLTHVARRINAREVIRQVTALFERHGVPRHIRSDNGPEFIAGALRRHLQEHHVEALYVEPGSPWQNGIMESFNGRLRDECLDVESFYSLEEARMVVGDYRVYYRDRRPHSALGYTTPAKYAAACIANGGVHPSAAASETRECPHLAALGRSHLAANRGDAVKRVPATENRVDGEGGEAPLPLQTSPTAPRKLIPATPGRSMW